MSKYEDQQDDCNVICPYCLCGYQLEGEDTSEDSRDEECENCGMTYRTYQSITVTSHADPDCELNGIDHDYKFHSRDEPKGYSCYFCETCGKCNLEYDTEKSDGEST